MFEASSDGLARLVDAVVSTRKRCCQIIRTACKSEPNPDYCVDTCKWAN